MITTLKSEDTIIAICDKCYREQEFSFTDDGIVAQLESMGWTVYSKKIHTLLCPECTLDKVAH